LIVVVLAADQLSKWLVLRFIPLHFSKPLLPFFCLTHVRNTGAAFGVYPQGNIFFIVMTLLILVILMLYHRLLSGSFGSALGLALVWAGALGNLVDRLFRGSVVDFLDFFVGTWHWYTFNVADSAISIGIALLLLDSFRPKAPADEPKTIGN